MTVVLQSPPTIGQAEVLGPEIRYLPPPDFFGTASLEYVAVDETLLESLPTRVLISVLPEPDPPVTTADFFEVDEDTELLANVALNDFDPDGEILTYSMVRPPEHGTATLAPLGDLRYLGGANNHGSDSVGYVATDGLFEISGEVIILIRPINDEPIAGDDFFSTLEGTVLTASLGGNDFDPDGDPLHCEPFAPPAHGEAIVDAECTLTYVPAPGFVGVDQLSYRAIDTGSAIATVFLEVVDRGDSAPVFTSEPPLSVVQAGTYVYDADAFDGDIGDVLTYSLTHAPLGTTIDPITGLIQWIPSRLQTGEGVKFIVAVTDLTLQTVEQIFDVSVVSTVDAPVIASTAPVDAIAGQLFVYQIDAVDLDPGDAEFVLELGRPWGLCRDRRLRVRGELGAWTADDLGHRHGPVGEPRFGRARRDLHPRRFEPCRDDPGADAGADLHDAFEPLGVGRDGVGFRSGRVGELVDELGRGRAVRGDVELGVRGDAPRRPPDRHRARVR
ncbi:MAG: tandem-95 repeat protein [Deltaproteobacteria bacterium]|nr:tandem-95 repeat protein [Deltaproteobacteria bacterium]